MEVDTPMLLEEKEMRREGYKPYLLDHGKILISPEIDILVDTNAAFDKLLSTALNEIIDFLDKEIGRIDYIIEVSTIQDHEYPDWIDNVIKVKVPIKDNPKYVLQLWDDVSDRVWDKISSITENVEEIERISDNTRISFRILE
jgi:hypothetical protein